MDTPQPKLTINIPPSTPGAVHHEFMNGWSRCGLSDGRVSAEAIKVTCAACRFLLSIADAVPPEPSLAARLSAAEAERDALKRDWDAEASGKMALRKHYGARDNETWADFLARMAAAEAKAERMEGALEKHHEVSYHAPEWCEVVEGCLGEPGHDGDHETASGEVVKADTPPAQEIVFCPGGCWRNWTAPGKPKNGEKCPACEQRDTPPAAFKVGDRVTARREGAKGAGVIARIDDGRYHYLSKSAGAYPYLASELTHAPEGDGNHDGCGELTACPKCKGSRYDRDFDGSCLECVAKERDALRAELEKVKAERDEAKRHDAAIEEMLTGAQADARAQRQRADRAEQHRDGCARERDRYFVAWGKARKECDAALARVAELEAHVASLRVQLSAVRADAIHGCECSCCEQEIDTEGEPAFCERCWQAPHGLVDDLLKAIDPALAAEADEDESDLRAVVAKAIVKVAAPPIDRLERVVEKLEAMVKRGAGSEFHVGVEVDGDRARVFVISGDRVVNEKTVSVDHLGAWVALVSCKLKEAPRG